MKLIKAMFVLLLAVSFVSCGSGKEGKKIAEKNRLKRRLDIPLRWFLNTGLA
jgi:hypothetical protein